MKFKFSLPTTDPDFQLNNPDWVKVKINLKETMIVGLFLSLFLALILDFLLDFLFFKFQLSFQFIKYFYFFFLIIIIHELLHLFVLPSPSRAIMGISLKHAAAYVASNEILTKKRYLLTLIFPTIILTIVPIVLLIFYKWKPLAYLAIYNLMASSVDIIMFYRICQFPKQTLFKTNGKELYHKNSI